MYRAKLLGKKIIPDALQYRISAYLLKEKCKRHEAAWSADPVSALSNWYFKETREGLDLANPATFNQKMQWLKMFDSTPLKGRLSDKLLVRGYVRDCIGDDVLLPIFDIWDDPQDINFEELPNKYALKATNGSGFNIIVNNNAKLNKKNAIKKMQNWLGIKYAFLGYEMHYQYNNPRVFAEPHLDRYETGDLIDYKISCFNNGPAFIQVMRDRGKVQKVAFYDDNWNRLNMHRFELPKQFDCPKPKYLKEMINFSRKLADGFPFARVDWYETMGHLYFGEITFAPNAGICRFVEKQLDRELGDRIALPERSFKQLDV